MTKLNVVFMCKQICTAAVATAAVVLSRMERANKGRGDRFPAVWLSCTFNQGRLGGSFGVHFRGPWPIYGPLEGSKAKSEANSGQYFDLP